MNSANRKVALDRLNELELRFSRAGIVIEDIERSSYPIFFADLEADNLAIPETLRMWFDSFPGSTSSGSDFGFAPVGLDYSMQWRALRGDGDSVEEWNARRLLPIMSDSSGAVIAVILPNAGEPFDDAMVVAKLNDSFAWEFCESTLVGFVFTLAEILDPVQRHKHLKYLSPIVRDSLLGD